MNSSIHLTHGARDVGRIQLQISRTLLCTDVNCLACPSTRPSFVASRLPSPALPVLALLDRVLGCVRYRVWEGRRPEGGRKGPLGHASPTSGAGCRDVVSRERARDKGGSGWTGLTRAHVCLCICVCVYLGCGIDSGPFARPGTDDGCWLREGQGTCGKAGLMAGRRSQERGKRASEEGKGE